MDQYVGLDVSQDETHVCVVDRDGNKLWEGSCPSTPEGIGAVVEEYAPNAVKIGLPYLLFTIEFAARLPLNVTNNLVRFVF